MPVPISEREKSFRSMKFIIESCSSKNRDRKKMKFFERLAIELLDAYKNEVIKIFNYNLKLKLIRSLFEINEILGSKYKEED